MESVVLPGTCLHRIFKERSRAAPERIALSTENERISYLELDERSDLLAARLAELGVRPNILVGLCAYRSPEAIVGMLGILKAGGAYVPIDPDYPPERIDYLLADCAAPIVVAAADTAELMAGRHPAMVWIEGGDVSVDPDAAALECGGPSTEAAGHDLAYVIYTSGSTGAPKGVAVEHRNAVRLFEQTQLWYEFDHRDTWTLFHSISFDFSVWEIWGALLYGGRLVLLPETVSRSPALLISLLRSERVTVLNQTPSAFHQLLTVMSSGGNSTSGLALRLVVFGGERLDPRMLAPWIDRHGDQRPALVNMYGITETTVHCTYRRITASDLDEGGDSPIGVPLPDLRVHVLDGNGNPVPDGMPGEMCIAGDGLARGYLNRPELTEERFVSPKAELGEERLYRSGDRAMRLPGGELVYLGRMDSQLKVRGYRIEPGEIEECLSHVPDITGVVVTSRDFGDGDVRLVAYLLPARTSDFSEQATSRLVAAAEGHARTALPRHLRPSVYRVVSEIPMTLQGKVNRDALGK
ncbi:amino acid adenylation domain-containing protein [Streptomyces sp. P9-2B-2]|uniref:amino acid adenylation domain-containing protein n=1 Tax=Streptomyces sp. P9-2B-2 TaxID=3057114 RepID=UPI0025B4CBA2|nr:amino acid adenylation domain-containing protein [Streptomyces sp. P9-2B-2]WJY37079.1 amino acid adenylation domain-containing protein [Streptomyces sp. P9-2B-2]